MTLSDGRTLGYAEYGTPEGTPMSFFHGYPGSRLEASGAHAPAARNGVRLIAPDRPGFGLSTPLRNRRIADWPADVRALMAHLCLPRVAVVGGSGGGPYALACAEQMPSLLSAVGVLAGAPPWVAGTRDMPWVSKLGRSLSVRTPRLAAELVAGTVSATKAIANSGPVARRIDAWLAQQAASEVSKEHTEDGTRRKALLRTALEGFAQGPQATVDEALLLTSDWGVDFGSIEFDPVRIWHGTNDARAPVRMIRWMAEQIPHAQLVEFDSGHFDIHKQLDIVFQGLLLDVHRR